MIQQDELKTIQSEIHENSIVFDVGANRGDWGIEILKLDRGCNLFCFEPNEKIIRELNANLSIYSNKFKIINSGLSREELSLDYYDYENFNELSSFNRRLNVEQSLGLGVPNIKSLKCSTLDKFCELNGIDFIDFLKVDTEGHELDVLLGSENLLSKGKISKIQFEYGGTYIDSGITLKQVFELLQKYDFKIFKLGEDRELSYSENLENFQYSNFLAKL